jgi:hypothetical protein
MTLRKLIHSLAAAAALNVTLGITLATAQDAPLSGAWNIAPSGKAASSGELLFRVTPGDGEDPVEVTVFVLSGSNETGIASSIRRGFTLQLDAADFDVRAGEGANVMVTQAASGTNFAVELVDSDVENVRVMVQSATPVAPPTVPPQSVPANAPDSPAPGAQPGVPGEANPPADAAPQPGTPASPSAPGNTTPSAPGNATPSAPPNASPSAPANATPSAPPAAPSAPGGSGAGASASPPG